MELVVGKIYTTKVDNPAFLQFLYYLDGDKNDPNFRLLKKGYWYNTRYYDDPSSRESIRPTLRFIKENFIPASSLSQLLHLGIQYEC